jgi:DegV family protein with EDD domain
MVKILTDSVADLPPAVVKEFGIGVVPVVVRFGEDVYRDGIDLTIDEFYSKLRKSKMLPGTSAPSPASFAEAYDRLAEDTDEILAVTVTSKLSATYDVAKQSVGLMQKRCRVEVLDSRSAAMSEGFVVMEAARAAQAGASLDEVVEVTRRTIPRVDFLCTFDTLEYLRRGGRIGKAQCFLGSLLKISPLIALKDGVLEPAGRAHSRAGAVERLYGFARSYSNIEEMAVEDTACQGDADKLVERLGAIFPKERIYRSRTSPVIGTHTGPDFLLVAILGDKK